MGFGWSLSIGKWVGVEVRLHSYFVLLVGLLVGWAGLAGGNPARGLVLWGLMVGAVGVREIARGVACAWYGLEVRSLMLLPTGGMVTYGPGDSAKRAAEAKVQWGLAAVGTLASLIFGLTVMGLGLALVPNLDLWSGPLVSPPRLVKALVWTNVLLGVLQALPIWPMDAGRVLEGWLRRDGKVEWLQTMIRLGSGLELGLLAVGFVGRNWWLVAMGGSLMLGSRLERLGMRVEDSADAVRVRDVMLTEYSIMSASATLEDAVMQARHTLQDVFPVVRGGNMVGAVGRGEVLAALRSGGNGYVQGIMAKEFQTAAPGDSVVETLGRVTGRVGASSQMVPVVEGERVVGILTPQSLSRSMGLVMRKSSPGARGHGAGADNEYGDERD